MQQAVFNRTLGIFGGGQLGRMTAQAAQRLGIPVRLFCPPGDAPAVAVCPHTTTRSYDDHDAVLAFARQCDALTLEFENIPPSTIDIAAQHAPVYPAATCLSLAQDRLEEKEFARAHGVPVADFVAVSSASDLRQALQRIAVPCVLKTRRSGYDGKGQQWINDTDDDVDTIWAALGGQPCILESKVDFVREISVLVARDAHGQVAWYPVSDNRHEGGILRCTTAPAAIPPAIASHAVRIGVTLAEAMNLYGLLAVELFLTRDGRLLFNEMAPRPHNSFHWTIEGCATSQFEQLVRIACGLPLGATHMTCPQTRMDNLIGLEAEDKALEALQRRGSNIHWYGKSTAKEGRKMGHVTTTT